MLFASSILQAISSLSKKKKDFGKGFPLLFFSASLHVSPQFFFLIHIFRPFSSLTTHPSLPLFSLILSSFSFSSLLPFPLSLILSSLLFFLLSPLPFSPLSSLNVPYFPSLLSLSFSLFPLSSPSPVQKRIVGIG